MTEAKRARWRLSAALVLLSGIPGCQTASSRLAAGAGLDEGPTRWLMLSDEMHQAHKLRTTREAVDFIEAFWKRRDPDPGTPGNEFSKIFYERVEAADRLYPEEGVRGSLTDRGRALILLGAPPVLRYSQKKVPAWDPANRPGAPPAVQTHLMSLESWVYAVAELSPSLQKHLAEEDPRPEIVLVFMVDPRHTYLTEGEKYLEMAARAAVRE